jgi:hypothetical protein
VPSTGGETLLIAAVAEPSMNQNFAIVFANLKLWGLGTFDGLREARLQRYRSARLVCSVRTDGRR